MTTKTLAQAARATMRVELAKLPARGLVWAVVAGLIVCRSLRPVRPWSYS